MADTRPRREHRFRNNRNQAVRIPVDFELPGEEAPIRRKGDRLIIEPVRQDSLLQLLAGWERLDEEIPDIDSDLPPPRDVTP